MYLITSGLIYWEKDFAESEVDQLCQISRQQNDKGNIATNITIQTIIDIGKKKKKKRFVNSLDHHQCGRHLAVGAGAKRWIVIVV